LTSRVEAGAFAEMPPPLALDSIAASPLYPRDLGEGVGSIAAVNLPVVAE
jgi:hypothetical protein